MRLEDIQIGLRVRISEGYTACDKDSMIGKRGTVISKGLEFVSVLFDGEKKSYTCMFAKELEPLKASEAIVEKAQNNLLPTDAKERKKVPIGTGVIDYFPAALAEVAKVSFVGNEQHNAGQPLHWARGKSTDQADTMIRHFLERGTLDSDGVRHSAKMCWRALAILQLELEAEGAPLARGAKE